MHEIGGKSYVCMYIKDTEKEIINLFRQNEVVLKTFIENQEEYIQTLEEALHDAIFKLEDIQYIALMEKEKAKKVRSYRPLLLEDIKKNYEGEAE